MNENIEVNNIIEVVNVGKLKDKVKKEGAVESDDDHPKNEEDVKYHESIINDIYGSMSDSEEDEDEDDDGEPSEEKQNKKLKREARKLQEEMKAKAEREQMQNAGIGEYLNKQVKEKVGQIFEQAKAKYQSDFNQEKVKGMFNNAYSKVYFVLLIQSTQFNDIVQKNNIQLPSIAELTQSQPKPHKTSLDQYLKISQPEAKKVNQETQEGKIAEKVEMKQEAQVKERDVGHEEKLEKKKTHFKINDGEAGENNEVSEKDDESEGEEFQDSEDEPDKQLEKQKENKVNDPLTQQMHTVTLEEEQKTLSTEDSLNPTHREMNNSSHHKRSSSWENTLVKGQEIDVSHIKLFQCKKESEKKNVIYQMVFNYETRYLSIIKGTLYSFELINIQPVLPFINNKDINTQNIKNLASRFFQSSKTKLFSYTSKQASDQVEPVVPPQVVDEPLQEVPQPDPNVKKAKLKGKIQLSRLFMIDITERGKKEIEIIMHFVNKHRNPLESPEIKRYRMNVDAETQLFLVSLEESIQRESEYYQIVMKEQSQRRKESE